MLRGPEMTPEHGSTDVTVSAIALNRVRDV